VVHERSVYSGDDGVERNPSDEMTVVPGTGFHRLGAAVRSRRFEKGFNRLLIGYFW
jgi:hypothetical protein